MSKINLSLITIFVIILGIQAQDFSDEFENLINQEKPSLLPEKMLITQRLLWGEKGLFRKTGISNLNIENREKELIIREKMLLAHQIIGYITFAGMIYQGILGAKLYNGDYSVYETHKTLGKVVTATYFTGAGLSLFNPPPLVNRKKEGLSNIRLHKILANIHVPAMIVTNIYADKQHGNKSYKEIHKASAYTAVASYTLAMLTIIFDF
ncbi:MAG: hypothetical protein ACJ0O6_00930 [Candidatus Marisimplicoccus sp.]|nr:MAG: Uncharacterised protein [Flavobacteriales bacterium]|tara:strand:- start:2376 stop:3002 length:627 start_codon:yes stop_codon:yes gene_type:complete